MRVPGEVMRPWLNWGVTREAIPRSLSRWRQSPVTQRRVCGTGRGTVRWGGGAEGGQRAGGALEGATGRKARRTEGQAGGCPAAAQSQRGWEALEAPSLGAGGTLGIRVRFPDACHRGHWSLCSGARSAHPSCPQPQGPAGAGSSGAQPAAATRPSGGHPYPVPSI